MLLKQVRRTREKQKNDLSAWLPEYNKHRLTALRQMGYNAQNSTDKTENDRTSQT